MTKPSLSIVIPAFNEERFIGRLLVELRRHAGALSTQVIVVDNGSTDATVALAKSGGADLVLEQVGTVGAIRNAGARHATADVLMFIDADVFPTAAWSKRIADVVRVVREHGRMLTGSWVSVPDDCGWLERHWFKQLEHGRNTHLNSGHMIVSRRLFEELGGFDPRLRTGEDFDLSMRARDAGAQLVDDVSLKVVHHGYPKTLLEFMRREVWHGAGDCQSLRGFLRSRVAVLGAVVLHLQVVGWAVSAATGNLIWGVGSTAVSLSIAATASMKRYPAVGPTSRVLTTLLYFCYFLARGASPYALGWNTRSRGGEGKR